MTVPLQETTTTFFEAAARRMRNETCRLGWGLVDFGTPPTDASSDRSLQRSADGRALVLVRIEGRAAGVVISDMADGVAAANNGRKLRRGVSPDEAWSRIASAGLGFSA